MLTLNDKLEQVWKTVEELAADPETESFDLEMLSTLIIFGEDGVVRTVIPLPEGVTQEEIDEAIESGECELYAPGFLTMEKNPWKEENGKVFFDTGIEGEILGEKADSWTEVIPVENGIQYATFRLVRAE